MVQTIAKNISIKWLRVYFNLRLLFNDQIAKLVSKSRQVPAKLIMNTIKVQGVDAKIIR